MPKYFVYILRCEGGTLYTGIARDVQKRFREHRSGSGAKYTRAHEPTRIVYTEAKNSRSSALKREHQIKSWRRSKKVALFT